MDRGAPAVRPVIAPQFSSTLQEPPLMTSPFLRNRQRKLAAQSGEAATAHMPKPRDEKSATGQEYAGLKVRLHDQLRQLQDVESHEARIPMKAQFVKDFAPWVDGVIEADKPVEDEIVMTSLVWSIDIGEFERAVEIGEFALRHRMSMPERYKRSVACFLREDIAEIAIADSDAVDLPLLVKIDSLTADADMPDAAKAKLHKALGRAWRAKADAFDASDDSAPAGGEAAYVSAALDQLRRALTLDKKAGVKKDIEQLDRRLAKLQESQGNGDPAD